MTTRGLLLEVSVPEFDNLSQIDVVHNDDEFDEEMMDEGLPAETAERDNCADCAQPEREIDLDTTHMSGHSDSRCNESYDSFALD
jgi:hypothetical protein